jgi:nucleotide-binding universal stress UspA family protein
VVGADGTRESLPVVEFAYRQAALRQLPLTVLHSFWDAAVAVAQYREASGRQVEEPDLEDLRSTLATSVAGLAEVYPDVPIRFVLKHGFADEALSPSGKSWDLIVVGRHPKTSVDRLLSGSISRSVLERASSTVAVVPEAVPTP